MRHRASTAPGLWTVTCALCKEQPWSWTGPEAELAGRLDAHVTEQHTAAVFEDEVTDIAEALWPWQGPVPPWVHVQARALLRSAALERHDARVRGQA